MSASGKSVRSQDSEWLPTGTSWITFWTAINPGSSRQHTANGTTREVTYLPGQTRHFHCAEGEYLLHDLKTWVTPNWCSRQSNFLTAPIPHCRFTESEAPQLRDFSSQG